jgi:hypothetical protein
MSLRTSVLAAFLASATACNVSPPPRLERGALELHVASNGDRAVPSALRGTLTVRGITNDVVLFAATAPGARSRYELPPGLYGVALNSDCQTAWSRLASNRNGELAPPCPPALAPVLVPVTSGQSSLLRLALVASPEAGCVECASHAGPNVVAAAFERSAPSDKAARNEAKR